ncbi:hypothetical protein N0V90_011455 [Kalmusia sp. IMI 367209]|nr:hypothetical protein N0V90_011455 [Kalmusia sp. IMI 367209]
MREVYRGGFLRPWRIDDSIIIAHLPGMAMSSQDIDLDRLARQFSTISGRVSEPHAYHALRSFFQLLRDRSALTVIPRLHRNLDDLLRKQHPNSSAKLRRHFITLAHLAYEGRSTSIADCLVDFFLVNRHTIATEDCRYLDDWDYGIRLISTFRMTPDVGFAMHYLRKKQNEMLHYRPSRYDPWDDDDSMDRGRRLDRYDRRHRSRTMPPVFYTPMPRIAAPNFLALPAPTGMMSGFPSPAVYANDPMRDAEMEDLRMQQQFLADKVNLLEYNQQVLEDDVAGQPGPFIPMRGMITG